MRENTVKTKWNNGEPAFGGWLSIPSSVTAEVMAHQGFDWLCIDMQHGLIDYQVALTMLQAISQTPTIPFVRVPWNEFGIIGKMLDAGAYGVIIPMVNSVEEAKQAVAACKYFPLGMRSFGPARAATYAGADYFSGANDTVCCIPMIETKQAVDRIDEILAVPGIDAVYVGPADLSITYGLPPRMDNDGVFPDALAKVVASCRAHGVTPGIHSTSALAAKRVAGGFRMITVGTDSGGVAAQAQRDLKTAREG
jgi:4-hydroxy-2-oxoheptanedioate aldolase